MRDLDPTEHDRSLSGEGVDIDAQARSGAETTCKPLLGALEITRQGELFEGWITFDSCDLHAGGTNDRGLIGGRGAGPAFIGGPQPIQSERLRRLNSNYSSSIDELV